MSESVDNVLDTISNSENIEDVFVSEGEVSTEEEVVESDPEESDPEESEPEVEPEVEPTVEPEKLNTPIRRGRRGRRGISMKDLKRR